MNRNHLVLPMLILFSSLFSLQAQGLLDSLDFDPTKVLNSMELRREPMFTDLAEAMREPSKVYKLSLKDTKLKQIPSEIFQMTNLHSLDLSNTKIRTIPPDIANLQYLQFLNLYRNKIKVLPDEIANLGQLQSMYLGRNKLTIIPAWVGGLGKLRKLDVSFNPLTAYEIEKLKYQLPNCKVTY